MKAMGAWFTANWDKILLSIVTTGALTFCTYLGSKIKQYQKLLKKESEEELDQTITEKIEPVIKEIEELRTYVRNVDKAEQYKINLIISSYKYRLTQLCRLYMRQRYMTVDESEQLNEFFHLYESLGGNGEAKTSFEQAMKLPVYATHEQAAEAMTLRK